MNLGEALIVATLSLATIHAVQVYDCRDHRTQVAVVDLRGPSECAPPDVLFLPPKEKRIQVVQRLRRRAMLAVRCKVTETREVTRCGFDSISYGTKPVSWLQTVDVKDKDCRRAAINGILKVGKDKYARTYEVQDADEYRQGGGTGWAKYQFKKTDFFYSYGGLSGNNHCSTTSFWSQGQYYVKSYETVRRTITVEHVLAEHRPAADTMSFSNHLEAPAKDGTAFDAVNGRLVWRYQKPGCSKDHASVYTGAALVRERILDEESGPYTHHGGVAMLNGTLVLVQHGLGKKARAMGFRVAEPVQVCGQECYSTQLDGTLICFLMKLDEDLKLPELKYDEDLSGINLKAQLAYLHLSTNDRMEEGFNQLQQSLCKLDRDMLEAKLASVAHGNPYALRSHFGPGCDVTVRGSAAYVTKCQPREAVLRTEEKCYREIPVILRGSSSHENETFADPVTFVVQTSGSEVPCSTVTPVRYDLDGRWYCSTPIVQPCDAPTKLKPHNPRLAPHDYTIGLDGGIFTEQQEEDVHAAREHSQIGRSIWHRASTYADDHREDDGSLGPAIDLDGLEEASKGWLTGHFPSLKWLWVLSLTVVISIALYCCRTAVFSCLRAALLPEAKSLSDRFIAAVSTAWLQYRKYRQQQASSPGPPAAGPVATVRAADNGFEQVNLEAGMQDPRVY